MALGIFSKVSLIAKSSAHSLLDKVIDANSVEAHEQLIRELESAIQSESAETIRADVAAKSLGTKSIAIQSKIDEFNEGIKAILSDGDPSNDHEAEPMMSHVIELEEERDSLAEQSKSATENYKLLSETLGKLRERHSAMLKELRALRTATSQAKADQSALNAVRKANDLTTGVDSMHLGGALENARQQSAVAREQLRQEVGEMQSTPEALLQKSKAAARLAEMRKQISG